MATETEAKFNHMEERFALQAERRSKRRRKKTSFKKDATSSGEHSAEQNQKEVADDFSPARVELVSNASPKVKSKPKKNAAPSLLSYSMSTNETSEDSGPDESGDESSEPDDGGGGGGGRS